MGGASLPRRLRPPPRRGALGGCLWRVRMSTDAIVAAESTVDAGPLGPLPRLDGRQARLGSRLARAEPRVAEALDWLTGPLGSNLQVDGVEVLWRASGI